MQHMSSFCKTFSVLIIYMKKLLDSDWLRAVQFKCNTGAKSVIQCKKCNTIDFLKSPSSCLFSKQWPLRGQTYSTLKFMRSTCGKSSNTSANYTS